MLRSRALLIRLKGNLDMILMTGPDEGVGAILVPPLDILSSSLWCGCISQYCRKK